MSNLPTEAKARKNVPLARGVLDYFPDALEAVAGCWITTHEHADAIVSHLRERGKRDAAGIRHSALIARHALALLQKEVGGRLRVRIGDDLRAACTAPPPLAQCVLIPFGAALAEVAVLSRIGNEQHNPGQPMHWAKEKSTDEPDALLRHLIDAGTVDTDGVRHSTKVAWRALALLQREIDAEKDRPIPYGVPVQEVPWAAADIVHVSIGGVRFPVQPVQNTPRPVVPVGTEVEHAGKRWRVRSYDAGTCTYAVQDLDGSARFLPRTSFSVRTDRTFLLVGDRVEITGTGSTVERPHHGNPAYTGRTGEVASAWHVPESAYPYTIALDDGNCVLRRFEDLRYLETEPSATAPEAPSAAP